MKLVYCSLLFLLFFFYCQQSKDEDLELAIIGNRVITVDEFKDRANFNPVIGNMSLKQHKERILNSIVAEALLSQSQSNALPDYLPLIIHQKNREAVIEKFWDEIIFKDIQISDSSLWEFYLNTNKQREIEFAAFDDSVHAEKFHSEWINNNPQVQKVLSRDTLSFSGNIAVLEKEVFHSKQAVISKPLKLGRKYIVYRVTKEWQTAPSSKQDFNEKHKSLKKSYLKTLKHEYFIAYSKKTFKSENYQLDKDLFKKLTFTLAKRLTEPALKEINRDMLEFSANENGMDSNAIIVNFDNGENWTVKEFINHLAVSPYPLSYSSAAAFRYSLLNAVKRMLDDQLLYRKGLQNDLDKSDYVTWQTAMWRDFYQAKAIAADNKYSVKKINQILDSLKSKTEINVKWHILDTLSVNKSDMVVLKTHFPGQTIVPKQSNWNFSLERQQ